MEQYSTKINLKKLDCEESKSKQHMGANEHPDVKTLQFRANITVLHTDR
jgi:hypothetical protein